MSISRFAPVFVAVPLGLLFRMVTGLEPVWWLAWVMPGVLLATALRLTPQRALLFLTLTVVLACSGSYAYFAKVTNPAIAICLVIGQSLPWLGAFLFTRQIFLKEDNALAVLAFPVCYTAIDSLMLRFFPDGNWGSISYTQADFLPVLQIASLTGSMGLSFVLSLFSSALAMLLHFGWQARKVRLAVCMTMSVMTLCLGFGYWRLHQADTVKPGVGQKIQLGLTAIDDAIGLQASVSYTERIWQQYADNAAQLRLQGAEFIVLPEKIAVLDSNGAQQAQQRLSALAAHLSVWLLAGVAITDSDKTRNVAWIYAPDGKLQREYQKQFLAPGERDFERGNQIAIQSLINIPAGLAIYKDMHFPALSRTYAKAGTSLLLVPAWDFGMDAAMAYNITMLRGIENGFAIVRSAREGWLTVSDAYGRKLAYRHSDTLPGSSLYTSLSLNPPSPGIFSYVGDWPGTLCIGGFIWALLRQRKAAIQTT